MLILACATSRECVGALNHAASIDATRPRRLTMAGREILACVVGVGPIAAALRIGAILEAHPEACGVVNVGICGSFDTARLPLGGICVANAEIWPEYAVRHADPEAPEALDFPMLPQLDLTPPNHLALDPVAAATAMGLSLPPTWTTGPSLTVAGVSGDMARAECLRQRYQAATENMEGFSLALAARLANLPFLEVRTVSNPVGARDKSQWDFKAALASLSAILPTLCEKTP